MKNILRLIMWVKVNISQRIKTVMRAPKRALKGVISNSWFKLIVVGVVSGVVVGILVFIVIQLTSTISPLVVGVVSGVVAGILVSIVTQLIGPIPSLQIFKQEGIDDLPMNRVESRISEANNLLREGKANDALQIYHETLKEVSKQSITYARIQAGIGGCYEILATKSDREYYLREAVKAYQETIDAYSPKEVIPGVTTPFVYRMEYAYTQVQLAETYLALAEFLNNEDILRQAILAYKEALRIYSKKYFSITAGAETDEFEHPSNYARTQNKLGKAYVAMAEFRDNEINLHQAIQAHEEAIKAYVSIPHSLYDYSYDFRLEYAETQKLLGEAYLALAEVTDKEENAGKAIAASYEAAKIYATDNYTVLHAEVMSTIESANSMLK